MTRNAAKNEYSPQEMELRKATPKYLTTYCGPTVLLLLTKQPYETLKAQINRRRNTFKRNKRRVTAAVKGLECSTMEYMLKKHGFKPKKYELKGVTLKTFCEDVAHMRRKIVIISGCHYLLLVNGIIYDTFQTEGCPYAEHPFAKTRMEGYWILNGKTDNPVYIHHALHVRYKINSNLPVIIEQPKIKPDLRLKRYQQAQAALKKWQTKEKRAKTAIKKLQRKVKYYQRIMKP